VADEYLTATENPRHIPALDGLRALAILLVVPHNTYVFESTRGWLAPFAWIANAGWIGVQLFFVLSGFLITRNLLDSRGASNYYSVFFGRRILRIFPLYFLVLTFFLLVLPQLVELGANARASYANQIWLWVFLSNWAQPFDKEVYWFPHFWSLAVEEQFYFVWPLIIATVAVRRLVPVCATILIAALAIRIGMFEAGAKPEMLYMFTVCRMDALACGALAAVLVYSPRLRLWSVLRENANWLLGAVLVVLMAGTTFTHSYTAYDAGTLTLGQTLLALCMTVLLLVIVSGSRNRIARWLDALLRLPPLRSVGKVSYAMYLFHLPLATGFVQPLLLPGLKKLGPGFPVWYALVNIVCSYALALASWHVLEKHFLRAKRYFVPMRGELAPAGGE
jgi:peptidoglycan/LPS O-acetylase OafA/YrhL